MADLTHLDARGNARMVGVGEKPITSRRAVAEGRIRLGPEALAAVVERQAKKGDVLAVAQLAGIQGAKRTSDWIPLCHPLPLTGVEVSLRVDPGASVVICEATAHARWHTGVEMEALCAVSAALLTVYDMLKATDRGMEIESIHLRSKEGGSSGAWERS
ncbi:MAG TPA: cyclic pyranopterin monophosphate synthase MoaC [Deltaproteobacteria bacterium]|nr:cyclic pyranopterin monophosphate synthase MoaC [Deltaproteobacteria bacterium]